MAYKFNGLREYRQPLKIKTHAPKYKIWAHMTTCACLSFFASNLPLQYILIQQYFLKNWPDLNSIYVL